MHRRANLFHALPVQISCYSRGLDFIAGCSLLGKHAFSCMQANQIFDDPSGEF